jgi:hypothetical protein
MKISRFLNGVIEKLGLGGRVWHFGGTGTGTTTTFQQMSGQKALFYTGDTPSHVVHFPFTLTNKNILSC